MTDVIRLARGCWLPAAAADDLLARCATALSVCAEDTLVSSTTAARLHGMWLPEVPDEIHLASAQPEKASRSMRRTQRPEFVPHRRQISGSDRVSISGVPVFSLEKTWLDLGSVLSLPDLVAAGDSALRLGATADSMQRLIRRSRRQRGVHLARAALPLLDARSRSRPESHLRVAVSVPDLPPFEVNEPVHRDHGGWLAEPDLSLVQAKIALEYQGAEHADVKRRRSDITRATDLRRERWLCIEYGPAEVFGRPWQIAPELRGHIRERAPHLLRGRPHRPGPVR